MRTIIKSKSLGPFCITNEITIVCKSNFFSCGFYTLASTREPHMCICSKLGFQPSHNSKGVLGTALVGNLFKIYTTIFKSSLHRDVGRDELLIILLTMFMSIRFLLSATPFCCGEPGIIYLTIMPCSLRKFTNGPGFCHSPVYLP